MHMCKKTQVRGRKFQNIRDAKRCLKLLNMIKDVRCTVLNLANPNLAALTLQRI